MCASGIALLSAASAWQPVVALPPATTAAHGCGTGPVQTCFFGPLQVAAAHSHFEGACAANTDMYRARDGAGPHRDDAASAPTASEPLTQFHSKIVPALSLLDLSRIMQQNTGCDDETLMMTVVLCARYCECAGVTPTLHLMHRLYVTSLHVAIKTHHDVYFRNDTFALLAGVSLLEMNALEATLVNGVEWRTLVTSADVLPLCMDAAAFFHYHIPFVPTTTATTTATPSSHSRTGSDPTAEPSPLLSHNSAGEVASFPFDAQLGNPQSSCDSRTTMDAPPGYSFDPVTFAAQ